MNENGLETIKKFLTKMTSSEIKEAIEICATRISVDEIESRFKYFCGICHNKIAEKQGDISRKVFKRVQRYFLSKPRGSGYHKEFQLRQFCKLYTEETLMKAVDMAFAKRRSNYWSAVCESLVELTGDDIDNPKFETLPDVD